MSFGQQSYRLLAAQLARAVYAKTPEELQAQLPPRTVRESVRFINFAPNSAVVCAIQSTAGPTPTTAATAASTSQPTAHQVVVSVRGTSQVENWLQNVDIPLRDMQFRMPHSKTAPLGWSPSKLQSCSGRQKSGDPASCQVHRGFLLALGGLFRAGLAQAIHQAMNDYNPVQGITGPCPVLVVGKFVRVFAK